MTTKGEGETEKEETKEDRSDRRVVVKEEGRGGRKKECGRFRWI